MSLREDEALRALKARIPGSSDDDVPFLLRMLRSTQLDVDAAFGKLERRRQFEANIPAMFITPHAVASLRSGAFALLGDDAFRRPVLMIRASSYVMSPDRLGEDRLTFLLLEYLQSVLQVKRQAADAATALGGSSGASATDELALLIVVDPGTLWLARDRELRIHLATLVDKYYPELIGQVYVCVMDEKQASGAQRNGSSTLGESVSNASRSSRMSGIAAGSSSGAQDLSLPDRKLRSCVSVVQGAGAILSHLSASIVPTFLGGTNEISKSCPGAELAEKVMRHWYLLTHMMQAESANASGCAATGSNLPPRRRVHCARRLSELPCCAAYDALSFSVCNDIDRRRQAQQRLSAVTATPQPGRPQDASPSTVSRRLYQPALKGRGAGDHYATGSESDTDSLCSALVDGDLEAIDGGVDATVANQQPSAFTQEDGQQPPPPHQQHHHHHHSDASFSSLRQQLELEVQRRRQLETQVQRFRLGVDEDDPRASGKARPIQAALRQFHEEVNILVAEVVNKSRSLGREPTAGQLFDATDRALMVAVQQSHGTTAMAKSGIAVDRRRKSTCSVA